LLPAAAVDIKEGPAFGLSNRETAPDNSVWVNRAERAYRNMAESLLPFACVVMVAVSSGNTGETSAMGATGSLAWFGGVIGTGMIVYQIL